MLFLFFIFILITIAVLATFRNLLYSILNGIVLLYERIFHRKHRSQPREENGRTKVKGSSSSKKKIIPDSEGEYVDYEEVR